MYFIINHYSGIVESADNMRQALDLIDDWLESGTESEDISIYEGTRRNFGTKEIKKSYIVSTFKTTQR